MTRSGCIQAARQVTEGVREDLRCPENDDDFLEVEWFPNSASDGGEHRLRCPSCGAESWIRQSRRAQ